MHTYSKTLRSVLYKYSYSIIIFGRRLRKPIPLSMKVALTRIVISRLAPFFAFPALSPVINELYKILMEICREGINNYVRSNFIQHC